MAQNTDNTENSQVEIESIARREFLSKAGRFAAVTTPAITVLLSTSMEAEASSIFKSGGGDGVKKHKIKGHHHYQKKKFWAALRKKLHKLFASA
ncbi:hypothetical protein [Palleronia aestuarii]|uniref:hypothetical protein n=1 Tax=Palleronia aestuarii TaxID=568105 RepID=UPI000DABE408|nr:hypothetical protein [Palleronia aestuarii]